MLVAHSFDIFFVVEGSGILATSVQLAPVQSGVQSQW